MEEQEENEISNFAAIGAAVVIGGAIGYFLVRRSERKQEKIRTIQYWSKTNEAAADAAAQRIRKALRDKSVTPEEFHKLVEEEQAFIDLIYSQPID